VIIALLKGLALLMIVEGLAWALAPSYLERLLEALREIPPEARRWMGLGVAMIGAVLLWLVGGR
jgi:uncharacterized protein YjeT (DUF2065 family)